MIIFFHGPPCSGKTTLSNKLSIELGVPRFSTDQIRINTIDLQSYDKNMAKKVFDQFIEMIELEHKNDVFLIAESMLISEYRKEKLFRHFGKWLVVVKCECSVSKALERLENRIRSRKNSEGKSGETLSQEKLLEFYRLYSESELSTIFESHLVLSTECGIAESYNELTKFIFDGESYQRLGATIDS